MIAQFQNLLKNEGCQDKVELKGAFCMEHCGEGINWKVDEEIITSSNAEDAVKTFREKVLNTIN